LTGPGNRWRIAKAVVEGTSHAATGVPCQDYADINEIETEQGPVLLAVVSDGAGSATHSDIGSWLATKTVLELIELHFEEGGSIQTIDRPLAGVWIERVGLEMANDASRHERVLRDYACTLLVAIVGETGAAFLQVGDGGIVTSRAGDEDWTYVFWPQHGEFANTTNFVVSDGVMSLFEFASMPERVEEIALFSDGLENLVLHQASRSVHEPFFRAMMVPVRKTTASGIDANLCGELETYLRSPRVCGRTDDDKSLILASRWPGND
jgi:Protein phosphatase 2C